MSLAGDESPTSVRLPSRLRARLAEAAGRERRSLSAEIVLRLEREMGMGSPGDVKKVAPIAPASSGDGLAGPGIGGPDHPVATGSAPEITVVPESPGPASPSPETKQVVPDPRPSSPKKKGSAAGPVSMSTGSVTDGAERLRTPVPAADSKKTGCWDHRGSPKSWCQACKNMGS